MPNTAVKLAPFGRWTRRKRRAPYLHVEGVEYIAGLGELTVCPGYFAARPLSRLRRFPCLASSPRITTGPC